MTKRLHECHRLEQTMERTRLDDAMQFQGQENGGDVPYEEASEGSSDDESAWIE